jgi:hypothetical protein
VPCTPYHCDDAATIDTKHSRIATILYVMFLKETVGRFVLHRLCVYTCVPVKQP